MLNISSKPKGVVILGVRFDSLSMLGVVGSVQSAISSNLKIRLAFSNPEFLVVAHHSKMLRDYLNGVDLNLADGAGVVLASRLYGSPLPERVTGTDFVYELAKLSAKNDYGIFLFGGHPGVADLAKDRLRALHPECRIVGSLHGYFKESDTESIVKAINEARPHILMVCLGNPKQEAWIQENFERLNVNVVFGNGGALDFAAGIVTRAPEFMRRLGLEWLWRLGNDFSLTRLHRLLRLPVFCWMVLRELVSARWRPQAHSTTSKR